MTTRARCRVAPRLALLGLLAGALAGTAGARPAAAGGALVDYGPALLPDPPAHATAGPLADYGPAPLPEPRADAEVEARAQVAALDRRWPRLGLMLDAGVPDGLHASLVLRPWYWLRLHAGAGYNFVSPGVRGGVTVAPVRAWITPAASVEAGHYFRGDASAFVGRLVGEAARDSALLQSVGYTYVNLHLGLEVGSRRAVFYVHGGWSWVDLALHQGQVKGLTITQAPHARVTGVSGRLGFIVYLI